MHRRAMMAGMLGLALGAVPRGRLLAQSGQPADLAGCLAEPGIALYLDVFESRSTMSFQELLPGTDWLLFSSPYSLVTFLYPPDWPAQLLYASTFTQNAAPIWTADIPQAGGVLSARVMSPDSSALWEYVAGTLQGVALSIEQAVAIAEGGVLGDGYDGARLCLYTEPTLNGGTAWLTAIERDGLLVLTNGTLYADTSGFSPFSVITYYSLAAPRATYEQTMRQVFLPIQWQLLKRGGEEPVWTPTP
jgi:hypothetical protein